MTSHIAEQSFQDFPETFKGPTLRPGEDGYGEARLLWNMRRAQDAPALIVRPLDVDDVVTAVRYAERAGTTIAVRSGGHGVDGYAMPDGALVVDFSLMRRIDVDPATGHATIEAGVLLGEMDAATQEHGLVVPAGVVTDTGAAGLTLGGGVGHLTRRFGATVDNLLSIEVVTMDGRATTASAELNPDLFWGMRGAGHNLAIATSFTFQARRVGPQVISGVRVYPADEAIKLCAGIDEAMSRSPRELSIPLIFAPMPPLAGVPPEAVGAPVMLSVVVYTGPPEEFDAAIAAVDALARPLADMVRPATWCETNSLVDAFQPIGRRYQSKGGYVPAMSAELAQLALERVAAAPPATPTTGCLVGFPMLGGALLDADEDTCAFSRTGASWVSEIVAMWEDEAADDGHLAWVDETLAALEPHSNGVSYVNLTAHRGDEWLRGTYGSPGKWNRIVKLKHKWDPDNRLAHNKNVLDAVAAA